jgi:oligopeptide transport system ATP-binding protein
VVCRNYSAFDAVFLLPRRSQYALDIDFKQEPPWFKVSPTHFVKSWLLDATISGGFTLGALSSNNHDLTKCVGDTLNHGGSCLKSISKALDERAPKVKPPEMVVKRQRQMPNNYDKPRQVERWLLFKINI